MSLVVLHSINTCWHLLFHCSVVNLWSAMVSVLIFIYERKLYVHCDTQRTLSALTILLCETVDFSSGAQFRFIRLVSVLVTIWLQIKTKFFQHIVATCGFAGIGRSKFRL
jgi:hypothetical protein